ncbi:hypothetical protein Q8A67_003016 [Cirrhinus molitorella]|uniref:Uncharacterized protein n=1 Tax=Cirrhinus molitorella TaxID=172907 RepID=A0AA88Q2S7_9TELE|nr:hypothetical protein Q8A67_003016 [Cirrhinus molitorella]
MRVRQMKSQVESKTGTNFAIYTPVDFVSKNEGEVNYTYIVKVNVGDKCVHPKIFQDGGGVLTVQDAHYPKTTDDPLVPF